jgi:hypothetical protein
MFMRYTIQELHYNSLIYRLGIKAQKLISRALDLQLHQIVSKLKQIDDELIWILGQKSSYNPSQPRVPAGKPNGGQWTDGNNNTEQEKNMNTAIEHINKIVEPTPKGRCANHVRRALNKGGFDVKKPKDGRGYAKNFDKPLEDAGFDNIASNAHPAIYPPEGYRPQAGDVVVMESYPAQTPPAGHMAIYDGRQWISDFRQREFWPGDSYRNYKPSYAIYRYPDHTPTNP